MIYILHKSLYNLNQAPLLWVSNLKLFLNTDSKYNLACDRFVFFKPSEVRTFNIILSFVVDVIFILNKAEALNADVTQLLNNFEGTEEHLNWYIGVYIFIKNGS